MSATTAQIYDWLAHITDPEVPVLSILDLGIVRNVTISPSFGRGRREDSPGGGQGEAVTVTITPTYSGCPAMDVIGMQIRMTLAGRGFSKVDVEMQLKPAWTTAWMTEEGKRKLREYGIAPPQYREKEAALFEEDKVPCPRCNSTHTELVSQYGATACKSMYRCLDCKEPFEHFKCH